MIAFVFGIKIKRRKILYNCNIGLSIIDHNMKQLISMGQNLNISASLDIDFWLFDCF